MTIEGAIAALQNLIKADDVPFYYNGVIQKVIETIIDECKPTTGKWEIISFKTIPTNRIAKAKKCSVCGKRKDKYVVWNYCPNCGAKMEGNQ